MTKVEVWYRLPSVSYYYKYNDEGLPAVVYCNIKYCLLYQSSLCINSPLRRVF